MRSKHAAAIVVGFARCTVLFERGCLAAYAGAGCWWQYRSLLQKRLQDENCGGRRTGDGKAAGSGQALPKARSPVRLPCPWLPWWHLGSAAGGGREDGFGLHALVVLLQI